jgi:hypothetical protein
MTTLRIFLRVFLVLLIVYLALGLAFHVFWQSAQDACRQERVAQGEFVEPEVFGWPISLFFDLTFWPVYASANLFHDGTPFATPCSH